MVPVEDGRDKPRYNPNGKAEVKPLQKSDDIIVVMRAEPMSVRRLS